jgi:hypothetical protein
MAKTNKRSNSKSKSYRKKSKKSHRRHRTSKRPSVKKTRKNTMKRHRRRRMHGGIGVPTPAYAGYNAADINPSGNYYELSKYGVPSGRLFPPVMSNPSIPIQLGGRRKGTKGRGRGRKHAQRGGSFFSTMLPQDLVNAARSSVSSVLNLGDKFSGQLSPASRMVYPTQQPLVPQVATNINTPPDILQMHTQAGIDVSNMGGDL